MRRSLRLGSSVLLCIGTLYGSGRAVAQMATPPNVLFIAVDDLNDWVGPLGGHPQARTPNIDRLAARGAVFTNAFSNSPHCSPSRESLFTGRQPFNLGIYSTRSPGQALPRTLHETIPEYFRARGYQALGAGKLFHSGGNAYPEAFDEYGPGIGFSGGPFTAAEMAADKQNPTYTVDRGAEGLNAELPLSRMPDDRRPYGWSTNTFDWGPVDVTDEEMPDGQIASWAVEQLQRERAEPFFLAVGFFRPHQPLYVPRKYFEPFPVEDALLPATQPGDLRDLPFAGRVLALEPFTAGIHQTVVEHDQWRAAVAGYLASVYFVDAQIGRVLDALDASPYAGNTAIVFFSDHGYHLGEKEHWGKWAGWSPAIRIPLIIVPPRDRPAAGFRSGIRSGAPVSLVDLYPTLVELAGFPAKDGLEGRSLIPLLSDPDAAWNDPVVSTFGRGNHALRDRQWHYIHYFDGSEELYDVMRDPHQWHNLATDAGHDVVLRDLRSRLPVTPGVAHFVRQGRWKAVIYDDGRPPELFRLGPMDISERSNFAAREPEVMARIVSELKARKTAARHIVLH